MDRSPGWTPSHTVLQGDQLSKDDVLTIFSVEEQNSGWVTCLWKIKSNKSKFIFFFLGFACSEEGLECCHLPGHCNKVKCWKSMLVQRRRGGERDCFHSPEQPSCWNSIAGRTSVGSPWKWPRERWLALYRTVGREMVSWRQLLWYF